MRKTACTAKPAILKTPPRISYGSPHKAAKALSTTVFNMTRARLYAAPRRRRVLPRDPSRFTITNPAMTRATPVSSSDVGCSDKISQASTTVRTGTPRLDIPATVALTRRTPEIQRHQPRTDDLRVGQAGVSTDRARWSPYNETKQQNGDMAKDYKA